jgi:hypothetical protein
MFNLSLNELKAMLKEMSLTPALCKHSALEQLVANTQFRLECATNNGESVLAESRDTSNPEFIRNERVESYQKYLLPNIEKVKKELVAATGNLNALDASPEYKAALKKLADIKLLIDAKMATMQQSVDDEGCTKGLRP